MSQAHTKWRGGLYTVILRFFVHIGSRRKTITAWEVLEMILLAVPVHIVIASRDFAAVMLHSPIPYWSIRKTFTKGEQIVVNSPTI
jgi:hypothetical protein